MALTLHTPDIVFDQSCDCGKLHHGTVKTHVILAGLLIAGFLLITGVLLVSLLSGEEAAPVESPAATAAFAGVGIDGELRYDN